MFTARYALSRYIKQIRFVFKGLIIFTKRDLQYIGDLKEEYRSFGVLHSVGFYWRASVGSDWFLENQSLPAHSLRNCVRTCSRHSSCTACPLEHGTDIFSRNVVTKYQYTLRNTPEEQRSRICRRGCLKSRTFLITSFIYLAS
jgi:hypothetical protein